MYYVSTLDSHLTSGNLVELLTLTDCFCSSPQPRNARMFGLVTEPFEFGQKRTCFLTSVKTRLDHQYVSVLSTGSKTEVLIKDSAPGFSTTLDGDSTPVNIDRSYGVEPKEPRQQSILQSSPFRGELLSRRIDADAYPGPQDQD
ncbi:hypothetical protein BDZ89DRAFT_1135552 [Hymenopellis radicata]|nr:hypothetical protein BDZ89DRAFT_1135552 [Hymenopellis radicata]